MITVINVVDIIYKLIQLLSDYKLYNINIMRSMQGLINI